MTEHHKFAQGGVAKLTPNSHKPFDLHAFQVFHTLFCVNSGRIHEPSDVHIIGGGLAGSEAAWQLARRGGLKVRLSEMRGTGGSAPQRSGRRTGRAGLLEFGFRSDDHEKNAVGLLSHEMRAGG